MYRHDLNYMCAPFLTGNGSTGATTPYNDKCSKQEGVKAGRPTPYIGAPSDVNFLFSGPDIRVEETTREYHSHSKGETFSVIVCSVFSSDFKD